VNQFDSLNVKSLQRRLFVANFKWIIMQLSLEQVREKLREELPSLRQKFSVKSLAVFGSVSRHDPQPNDLDLLVEFYDPPGLLGFIELEYYLSDLLGVKVDLGMLDGMKPRISQRVAKEMVAV